MFHSGNGCSVGAYASVFAPLCDVGVPGKRMELVFGERITREDTC